MAGDFAFWQQPQRAQLPEQTWTGVEVTPAELALLQRLNGLQDGEMWWENSGDPGGLAQPVQQAVPGGVPNGSRGVSNTQIPEALFHLLSCNDHERGQSASNELIVDY